MKYVLDTHTFIWMASDSDRLSEKAAGLVSSPESELLVSAATAWEVTLLQSLGRIELPDSPERFIPEVIHEMSLTAIDINFEIAIAAASLPMIHRDPFDRLIVATAMYARVPVISKDAMLSRYDVEVIWD